MQTILGIHPLRTAPACPPKGDAMTFDMRAYCGTAPENAAPVCAAACTEIPHGHTVPIRP